MDSGRIKLGHPPLAQALAVKQGLKVSIGGYWPINVLGSRERRGSHPEKIADLIIGDCISQVGIQRRPAGEM